MKEKISSTSNPRIKDLLLLQQKARERRQREEFTVEGLRELQLAMAAGYSIKALFVCPSLFRNEAEIRQLDNALPMTEWQEITPNVFDKLAYRDSSDGIIAVMVPRIYSFSDLESLENPLFIVLEAVEKPGNLGAVLRTADAAAADAVIVCDPRADLYNPNTIRSSIGCVFTVPVISCDSQEAILWFKSHGIKILTASLAAKHWYHETPMDGPLALVMGTEATGLTPQWIEAADENIKIPMRGKIDSLNVSVSTAILVFEAMRQRKFKKPEGNF